MSANQLKIATNLQSLRYAGDYFGRINIRFEYHPNAGIFELSCLNPDIIISNNYHESIAVSNEKPSIKIVGPKLQFPNYHFDIPPFLLDELSVLVNRDQPSNYRETTISYYNDSGPTNHEFICKLQSLGPTKILGNGFGPDELTKFVNQRGTPILYNRSKICGATSVEEVLKILFMGKPCLSNFPYNKYCYQVDTVNNLDDIVSMQGQSEYAFQFSHTVTLSKLLDVVGLNDYSEQLNKLVRIERT